MRILAAGALALAATASLAASPDRGLQIYWVDVEGGGATLVVTPARESILIDTGFPGERDAGRIHRVATSAAGLSRIDHVIVTHYHRDHFGGVADLARRMPVGTVYARDLATAPEAERTQSYLEPFKAAPVERREAIAAGGRVELKQTEGTAPLRLDILGASGEFAKARSAAVNGACRGKKARDLDASDNKNSVVSLLSFGPFRFFDGGDLSWNAEADLVCPHDRAGPVDVYQTDGHGGDNANNPALLRTLIPHVVVMNNGPRKGGAEATLATLGETASIQALYQMHRSLEAAKGNAAAERIANVEEEADCGGQFIRLSVDPDGRAYTMWVPATGHRRTYATRGR
jgi:beta-lactamase superfamily II metal-dependent hydrolase